MYAHTFLLTQGDKSTTVWLHRTETTKGLWKSAQPSFDFQDTSDHDQFIWDSSTKIVIAANDIGLHDTGGAGHDIDFRDTSSWAFRLNSVSLADLHRPASGDGVMYYAHSHILKQGAFDWEYQSQQLIKGWNV